MSIEMFNKFLNRLETYLKCIRCQGLFPKSELFKQDDGNFICVECEYKITGNLKGE